MVTATSETDVGESNLVEEPAKEKEAALETLLAEGKRAYFVGELATAYDDLSKAAELSVQLYGVFDKKVFLPHLYYGKTLLDMSRVDEGIFSSALRKHDDGDEENEDDDAESEGANDGSGPLKETVDDAPADDRKESGGDDAKQKLTENVEQAAGDHTAKNIDTAETGIKNVEEVTEANEAKADENARGETKLEEAKSDAANDEGEKLENEAKENADLDVTESEKGDEAADEAEEATESAGEDDVEHLQLAWEVLEVARAVCDRYIDEEGWKEKKAEVLLALGECSIEDENYKQAIDDLTVCVELERAIFSPCDRRIAEVNFQMARAYSLNKEFPLAAEFFEKSKKVLLERLAVVENELLTTNEKEVLEKEVGEINDLLPTIQAKIDDSLESARNVTQVEKVSPAKGDLHRTGAEGDAPVETPVSDITELVRKKPIKRTIQKTEAETVAENGAKRAKQDDEAKCTECHMGGSAVVDPGTNGEVPPVDVSCGAPADVPHDAPALSEAVSADCSKISVEKPKEARSVTVTDGHGDAVHDVPVTVPEDPQTSPSKDAQMGGSEDVQMDTFESVPVGLHKDEPMSTSEVPVGLSKGAPMTASENAAVELPEETPMEISEDVSADTTKDALTAAAENSSANVQEKAQAGTPDDNAAVGDATKAKMEASEGDGDGGSVDTVAVAPEEVPILIPDDASVTSPDETPPTVPEDAPATVPNETTADAPDEIPTAVPDEKVATVPDETPTAASIDSSAAVPDGEPATVPDEAPPAASDYTPAAVPDDDPAATVPDEAPPAASGAAPAAVPDEELATVPDDAPAAASDDTPAAASDDTPAAITDDTATTASDDTPATVPEDTTVIVPDGAAVTIPDETPAAVPEKAQMGAAEDVSKDTSTVAPEGTVADPASDAAVAHDQP